MFEEQTWQVNTVKIGGILEWSFGNICRNKAIPVNSQEYLVLEQETAELFKEIFNNQYEVLGLKTLVIHFHGVFKP